MKRFLISLLAALALPTAVKAGYTDLGVNITSSSTLADKSIYITSSSTWAIKKLISYCEII